VATTAASTTDVKASTPVDQQPDQRGLLPAEHYLDSGYSSAQTITTALDTFGVTLVTPELLDQSVQARAGAGFDQNAFTIDWPTRQATCPRGNTSAAWSVTTQRGTDVIVVKFAAAACDPCPVRAQCTASNEAAAD
jgi:hypothetical protein